MNESTNDKDDGLKINLDLKINEVDENLQPKAKLSQVNTLAVSELTFNTGNIDRDEKLKRLFSVLDQERQKMFESNGGKGSVKEVFISILQATKNITDHKILPDEAIMAMFAVGTTVALDHTLVKDAKLTKDQLAMESQTRVLDNELDSLDSMLSGLQTKVEDNNASSNNDPLGLSSVEL